MHEFELCSDIIVGNSRGSGKVDPLVLQVGSTLLLAHDLLPYTLDAFIITINILICLDPVLYQLDLVLGPYHRICQLGNCFLCILMGLLMLTVLAQDGADVEISAGRIALRRVVLVIYLLLLKARLMIKSLLQVA